MDHFRELMARFDPAIINDPYIEIMGVVIIALGARFVIRLINRSRK